MALSLVTFLLALCTVSRGDVPTMKDLQEALNVGNKFWITNRSFNRTYPDGYHLCISATIESSTEKGCDFKQSYKAGNEWKSIDLHATFEEAKAQGGHPKFIVTRKEGKGDGKVYTLMHWDRSDRCGVLMLNDGDVNQYELHLQEGDHRSSSPCKKEYEKYLRSGEDYHVYTDDCKK